MSEIGESIHPEFDSCWKDWINDRDSLETEIQNRVISVRESVLSEFRRLGVSTRNGWLYYQGQSSLLDKDEQPLTADCAVIVSQVLTQLPDNTNIYMPNIRILYSEGFEFNDGYEFFTFECTIDNDGDVQLAISTYPDRDEDIEEDLPEPIVPLARWNGHSLELKGAVEYTETDPLYDDNGNTFYPLGIYTDELDSMYALIRMQELLAKVFQHEPISTGDSSARYT